MRRAITKTVLAVAAPAVAALLVTGSLQAQEPRQGEEIPAGRVVGQVLDDETDRPVQGATVRITDLDLPAYPTDRNGRFAFPEVPRGLYELEIRHLAYGTGTHLVNVPAGETVTLEIRLAASPIAVDSLVVTVSARATRLGRAGFFERERRGWGSFFSGGDVEITPVRHLLLSVPQVEVHQGRSAFDRRIVFRSGGRRCVPAIFVDGFEQKWAEGRVEEALVGLRVGALEVYRGHQTPSEFMTLSRFETRPCGAIVIWTRRD